MNDAIIYDTHVHSPFCGHTVGSPDSFAWKAWRRNLRGFYFTCHNPMPPEYSPNTRMRAADWPSYLNLVKDIRQSFSSLIDVRLGLECDFFPGYEAFVEEQTGSEAFDYIIGSIHPFFPEYRKRYERATPRECFLVYFDLLAEAAESGLFDALAHPDVVKSVYPDDWSYKAAEHAILSALDRIAETGVALELNTSGLYKRYPEMNPGRSMLEAMQKRNIPVILGSDAHQPERLGDHFEEALMLLQDIGFKTVVHYIGRESREISIQDAIESFTVAAS